MQLNYYISLPFNLIQSLNKAYLYYNGNLMAFSLAYLAEIHFSLHGFAMEELLFGDLGYFNKSLVSAFYLPYGFTLLMLCHHQLSF